MTPKEKAIELIDKFWKWSLMDSKHSVAPYAKQCALIAVDEIMKQCWEYRDIDLQKSFDYWQEVKQEIEKL